jgi:hypothetical protein
MLLLERSRVLAARTAKLKNTEGLVAKTKEFGVRADRFETIAGELRAAAGRVRLLQARGVVVSASTALATASGIRRNVAEWRSAVTANDAAISAPNQAVQPKLIDPTIRLATSLTDAAATGWAEHVGARLPDVSPDLLALLFKIPDQAAKVGAFRSTFDRAETVGRKLPVSDADIDRFETYASQCQAAAATLEDQSISPEILTFFKAVSSPAGAAIGLLTPEVLTFLQSRGLTARYRIRSA